MRKTMGKYKKPNPYVDEDLMILLETGKKPTKEWLDKHSPAE